MIQDEVATLMASVGSTGGTKEGFQGDVAALLKWYDGGDFSKTNVSYQFHVANVNISLLAWTQTATAGQFQNSPMNDSGLRERFIIYHTMRVCFFFIISHQNLRYGGGTFTVAF